MASLMSRIIQIHSGSVHAHFEYAMCFYVHDGARLVLIKTLHNGVSVYVAG